MERVFVSWSGGKDCCLAGYRAAADGLDVARLLNRVDGDGSRGWVHGLRVEVVVAAEAERLGEKWLGRSLDLAALAELSELKKSHGVHPAGEAGEYHTLVIDGPTFQRRIEILDSEHVLRKDYWFLDISRAELRAK